MDESSEKKPDPLVVEDSSTQAEHLKYILEKHGYEVAVAKNGKEAIDYLNTNLPSIIISDVVMPEMDGFELCKRVKGDEKLEKSLLLSSRPFQISRMDSALTVLREYPPKNKISLNGEIDG